MIGLHREPVVVVISSRDDGREVFTLLFCPCRAPILEMLGTKSQADLLSAWELGYLSGP